MFLSGQSLLWSSPCIIISIFLGLMVILVVKVSILMFFSFAHVLSLINVDILRNCRHLISTYYIRSVDIVDLRQ